MRELSLLTVVAPMHDEEDTAAEFCRRTIAALEGVPFELIIVDDGSHDATASRLREAASADDRIAVIGLSRNFGHQAAISAGLDHARGRAVVMIDGDLQDPPELIPTMIEAWQNGADVVYAVRSSRAGETRFKLASARWFYRLFAKITGIGLAQNSGDFRLMDREPLEALLSMEERTRFLRGMTVWVGFNQTAVTYERAARTGGKTKFSPTEMVRFAFDAITSFSNRPLQAATLLGFVCSILAFLAIPLTIIARYADLYTRGVPTTIVIVLLLGGIQLITVGIIGEYVGRIYDEVKRRPLYVVRERVGIEEPE